MPSIPITLSGAENLAQLNELLLPFAGEIHAIVQQREEMQERIWNLRDRVSVSGQAYPDEVAVLAWEIARRLLHLTPSDF